MAAHRQPAHNSLYLTVAGWFLELLIGTFIGLVAGLVVLLTILWGMALSGTAW